MKAVHVTRTTEEEIRFGGIDSPVGRVHVGVSPRGLCRVSFRFRSEEGFLRELRRLSRGPARPGGRRVASVLEQLHGYFEDGRARFDCPLDLRGVTDFQNRVLEATRKIPPGRLVSYRDLAERIGSPRACRAVGNALGRNPVPIVIPCHRVVASGGHLGGFTGGVRHKKVLLRHEGHHLRGDRTS